MKIDIRKCDICGAVEQQDRLTWDNRHGPVAIECPPDGVNGGTIHHDDVCGPCRTRLWAAVCKALEEARRSGRGQ